MLCADGMSMKLEAFFSPGLHPVATLVYSYVLKNVRNLRKLPPQVLEKVLECACILKSQKRGYSGTQICLIAFIANVDLIFHQQN